MRKRVVDILLVEDDDWDAKMATEAFGKSQISNRIHRVVNGSLVFPFLRREGEFSAAPRPDLILLDLNLPKKDGREVLAELKTSTDFRRIPVLVFTTSKNELDVAKAYDLHANAYLNKPFDPEEYPSVVQAVEEFWFALSVPPPE